MATFPAPADAPPPVFSRRVGPYDIASDNHTLILRQENRGGLTLGLCLGFLAMMAVVLGFGLLAIFQMADTPPPSHVSIDDPSRLVSPGQNHFGIIWLITCGLLLLAAPMMVARAYRSALVYTFRRSDDALLRDNHLVTRLQSIEQLSLAESLDPDDRYLYILELIYGDGRRILIHEGYDERATMNLANEIGAFVHRDVVWR